MVDLITFGPEGAQQSPEEIQLQRFLNSFTQQNTQPLLPTPAATSTTPPAPVTQPATAPPTPDARRSGRLALQPTYGMPIMDKVQSVLLKKAGLLPPGASPMERNLQRYKDLYKRPMTSEFIRAITALASSMGKIGRCSTSRATRAAATGFLMLANHCSVSFCFVVLLNLGMIANPMVLSVCSDVLLWLSLGKKLAYPPCIWWLPRLPSHLPVTALNLLGCCQLVSLWITPL